MNKSVPCNSSEMILPLHSALMKPHIEYYVLFGVSHFKKDVEDWKESSTKRQTLLGVWEAGLIRKG